MTCIENQAIGPLPTELIWPPLKEFIKLTFTSHSLGKARLVAGEGGAKLLLPAKNVALRHPIIGQKYCKVSPSYRPHEGIELTVPHRDLVCLNRECQAFLYDFGNSIVRGLPASRALCQRAHKL